MLGGTSHSGKSTVAVEWGKLTGYEVISADKLARHPGRPWAMPGKSVPEHVVAHYGSLEPEALLTDVLAHYKGNVWPLVLDLVGSTLGHNNANGVILEGCALWPGLVTDVLPDVRIAAFWLTVPTAVLDARIDVTSRYHEVPSEARHLIDRFRARSHLYDQRMREAVRQHGLSLMKPDASASPEIIARQLAEQTRLNGHKAESS